MECVNPCLLVNNFVVIGFIIVRIHRAGAAREPDGTALESGFFLGSHCQHFKNPRNSQVTDCAIRK